jgi:DNA-binding XRE family transcriptional regulator
VPLNPPRYVAVSNSEQTRNLIRWYPESHYARLSAGCKLILNSLRKQFGLRVLQIRHDLGKSQEDFAEMIGMSVDFLSLIERGRNAPSFEKLERMAAALRVPVAYLFTFDRPSSQTRNRH